MTRSLTSAGRTLDTLREDILRGTLPAGARLGEMELAERLGVSRTPVREALSRLAAEGLVELSPNRGARVASWSVDELEGVFALRSLLEPQLTALAVPHATAADLDDLDDLAQRMIDLGDRDLDGLVPLNRAFHDRLVALAAAPALATALAAAVHSPLVARNIHAYDGVSLRRSMAHHDEIVAALRARDPEWARAVMTAHIHNARAVMVRAAAADPADPAPHREEETP